MNKSSDSQTHLKVINASAGSGKTTRLVGRILAILNSGTQPDKLCATTFTRKAAYEISSRLYKVIADTVLGKESALMSEVRAESLIQKLTIENCTPRIATIDSFFSGAGRTFSFELGLPPDWSIVPESESREILEQLTDELIQTGDRTKIGTLIRILKNDRSVRSLHDDLIKEILFGLDLWREVSPEDRIGVWNWVKTPNKSRLTLDELVQRLTDVELPTTADGKKIDTNFGNSRTKLVGLLTEKNFREALKVGLLDSVINGSNKYSKKEIPTPLMIILKDVQSLIEQELGEQLLYKALAIFELMSWFNEAYLQRVRQSGSLSYDDLKLILSTGLESDWSQKLALRLDTKFDHLLFDEFQDTSLNQWNYFKRYAEEVLSNEREYKSLFIVGDKKQSIYGWRGGVKELFDKVSGQIENACGNIESIFTSYRSSPAVISLVNEVFGNVLKSETASKYNSEAKSWLKDFTPHLAFNQELKGEVAVVRTSPEERITKVVELAKQLAEDPDIKEIGILVRTNKELRLLAKIFDDEKIAVSQEGGAALENEPLCIVIVNFLQLLDHPSDTRAGLIVASSILGDLLDYKNHSDEQNTLDLVRRVRLTVETYGPFQALAELFSKLRNQLSDRELTVLDEILEIILAKEGFLGPRLTALIPVIRKHKFERAREEKIRLLTAHSAKGLEFDVVFLAELGNSVLGSERGYLVLRDDKLQPPSKVVRYENKQIRSLFPELEEIYRKQRGATFEEALSVLYVSLTRAKRGLVLFCETKSKEDSFQSLLESTLSLPEQSGTIFGSPGSLFKNIN